MKTYFSLLALCFVCLGCGRDSREYELDGASIGADTIAQIEEESGIDLPDGTKGLKFHYTPPIDPIVFAKLEIPSEKKQAIKARISALTFSGNAFPSNFANDKCKWWPSSPANVVVSKEAFANGYYIEAHLVEEAGILLLYLKYFTI